MDKEKSLDIQVPTQAWVSIFALMDIDKVLKITPEIKLKDYIELQKKKTNLWSNNHDIPIYNVGTIAMMAYVFLVVPKEANKKLNLHLEDASEIKNILNQMDIKFNEKYKGLSKESNIMRHIRNSIAHVNYKLENNGSVFLIEDYKYNKKTFEGEISVFNFGKLIQKYFKIYYKEYLEKN